MEPIIIKGADKCPQCGSEQKNVEEVMNDLRETGLIPKESFKEGIAIQAALYDPTRQQVIATKFTIPIIQVRFEVCADCHTIYCTSVAVVFQQAEVARGTGRPFSPPQYKSN